MNQKLIVALAIVVIVILVGGSAAWILYNQNPADANPEPTPTPEPAIQEQVRDAAMEYIKTNHPETEALMTALSLEGWQARTTGFRCGNIHLHWL